MRNEPLLTRRGTKVNLPAGGTQTGELRWATDTKELFIDDGTDNFRINNPAGTGDMLLGTAQTVTAAKTFNAGTLKVGENVAVTALSTELNLLDGITVLSGSNTGDNATNTQYSGLASSKLDASALSSNARSLVASDYAGMRSQLSLSDTLTNLTLSANGKSLVASDYAGMKTQLSLGSAAYTASGCYATSAQGTLADNAVPKTTTITATAPLTINGTTSADLSANRTLAIGSGNVTVTAGNLVIATSGNGIDFSATADATAVAATGSIAGTKPNDGDTLTIDTKVYTFKTTLGTTEGNILIGADVAASLSNLSAAIMHGTGSGTLYYCAAVHPTVSSATVGTPVTSVTLTAKTAGSLGNTILLITSAARITVSAVSLTGGINATMSSELFNDYEEGTWDGYLVPQTSGSIVMNVLICHYTKKGREVTVTGNISVTSVSSPVGHLWLTGIPFAATNFSKAGFGINGHNLNASSSQVTGWMSGAQQAIVIHGWDSTTGARVAAAGYIKAGSIITFNCSYFI